MESAYEQCFLVRESTVIELKAANQLAPIHIAQVGTYLRLGGYPVALLVNFNVTSLRQGLRRLTPDSLPSLGSLVSPWIWFFRSIRACRFPCS